jgi:DNA-binding transcriptional MerR regulator
MSEQPGRAEVVVEPFSEPAEAARRLGVSASGLRRLAAAYEEAHGPLPRKGGTKARLFPAEALERLGRARVLVEVGRYRSTLEALQALQTGAEPEGGAEMPEMPDSGDLTASERQLEAVVGELRRLRDEVERLRSVVEQRGPAELPQDGPRPAAAHGLIVRAALWLERFLRRSR